MDAVAHFGDVLLAEVVVLLLEHVAGELVGEGFIVVRGEGVALVSYLILCSFLELVGIAIMKVSIVVTLPDLTDVFLPCCL